jgi:3-isopropylmalate dehydrogenase
MTKQIAVLPGDGIGPEVTSQATRLLDWINDEDDEIDLELTEYRAGGSSIDEHGEPLRDEVLSACQEADAILLGAVGGPKWDDMPVHKRPERALLQLREECELFANLRPAQIYEELVDRSPLKNEIAIETDFLVVRELTGGIYFSMPRGIEGNGDSRRGYNTLAYTEGEVKRITEVAIRAARERDEKITSLDKANVLESSKVWRETVEEVVPEDIELNHFYIDNASMQVIRDPGQFDVIVTGNLFGDIISDEAAQVCGSIGLLPSASLGEDTLGMYEPVHGSAPDIAGEGKANPLAAMLSVAMMCRYSLDAPEWGETIDDAVAEVINSGKRTVDLADEDDEPLSTEEMGEAVIDQLQREHSTAKGAV